MYCCLFKSIVGKKVGGFDQISSDSYINKYKPVPCLIYYDNFGRILSLL